MKVETQDVVTEAIKGGPAVAGTVLAAMTLNEWVATVTLVYVAVQLVYLIRKWNREEVDRGYDRKRKQIEDEREDAEYAARHTDNPGCAP